MSTIRPVLLVGAGDFSDLKAALQPHGFGCMVTASPAQARRMLEHFRVDAIVCVGTTAEGIASLSDMETPVVLIGPDPSVAAGAGCAAFLSESLELSRVAAVLRRVLMGERRIAETRGAA